jgi:hypothetical protein
MIALALKAERWRRYRRPAAWTAAWIALGAIAGLTIASVALYALALWRLPEVRSRLLYAGLAVVLAAEALTILQALVGVTIGTAGLAMSIASTGWLNREWLKGQWAETLHLRDWRNACQRCGLWEPATTTRPGRSEPRLLAVTATPTGTRLHVRLHSGWSPPDVQRAADRLASFYHARRVTVALDPADAGALDVTIVRHDPLAGAGATWPLRDAQRVSLWEPIPVAVDESGATVCVSLPGKHLLLGGQPGAGKSVAESLVVAAAALDPDTRLWLLDGKQVDLAAWRGRAAAWAGASQEDSQRVLEQARDWMEARYLDLEARHQRKVAPGDPLAVLVVDEMTETLAGKQGKKLAELLRTLVAKGRAAGLIVIAATQKPSSNVVPTELRDLFSYRWGLRCTTPDASDVTLGKGWASRGIDSSLIDQASPGIGYLLAEDGQPTRCRAYHLSDDDIDAIAGRLGGAQGQMIPAPPPGSDPDGQAGQSGGQCAEPPGGNGQQIDHPTLTTPPAPGSPARVPDGQRGLPERPRTPTELQRAKIVAELQAHPGDSNRAIAARVGCSHNTVAAQRRRMAAS